MTINIADIYAQMAASEANAKAEALAEQPAILAALTAAGVKTLSVEFDGAGDSGQIENVDTGGVEITDELQTLLEEWTYKKLSGSGVDWYNNDGGFGHLRVDMDAKTLEFEVNYRFTESAVGYSEDETFG